MDDGHKHSSKLIQVIGHTRWFQCKDPRCRAVYSRNDDVIMPQRVRPFVGIPTAGNKWEPRFKMRVPQGRGL